MSELPEKLKGPWLWCRMGGKDYLSTLGGGRRVVLGSSRHGVVTCDNRGVLVPTVETPLGEILQDLPNLLSERDSLRAETERLRDELRVEKARYSLLNEHVNRIEQAQKMFHNSEDWHDEEAPDDSADSLREWVDAPWLAIGTINHRQALGGGDE